MRDVRITRDETTWTASYHVDGGKLFVSSAWGSRTEPYAGDTPAERAEELLREIIG